MIECKVLKSPGVIKTVFLNSLQLKSVYQTQVFYLFPQAKIQTEVIKTVFIFPYFFSSDRTQNYSRDGHRYSSREHYDTGAT
jgi:hypothetical protein